MQIPRLHPHPRDRVRIQDAVEDGVIHPDRYATYALLFQEARDRERRW